MKICDLAYALHRRPYRDTSFLVDFFTQHHGIITAVCRGIRQNKKKQSLESFVPFWIEYRESKGHGNLVSLYQFEPDVNSDYHAVLLKGNLLYCGLYLNELLLKLLGRDDPYPAVFLTYQKTLDQLSKISIMDTKKTQEDIEKILRQFEWHLLREIGYGIFSETEVDTHNPILEDKYYYYSAGVGFSAAKDSMTEKAWLFEGKVILAMGREDFTSSETLKESKRLIRLTLSVLLENGGKLKSRELFCTL